MVIQLIGWFLYRSIGLYGLENPQHVGTPTPFGSMYSKIYLVEWITSTADALGVGGGLGMVGFIWAFAPLPVAGAYSAALALLIVSLLSLRHRS